MYASGKLIVVREIDTNSTDTPSADNQKTTYAPGDASTHIGPDGTPSTSGFVYRGDMAPVLCAKFNPAGTYIASGDARGKIRIWAYDHPEHLPKIEIQQLEGPVRDISWDGEGKRLASAGDGLQGAESARVVGWDTGVKCGVLGVHSRKKASCVAFKPNRPMRIATGGSEDATVLFHKGPPFVRVVNGEGCTVAEKCHERGSVHSLRYNPAGTVVASVGTDGGVCFYDGKTMELKGEMMEKVHSSSVLACAWNGDGTKLLTCGADGYVRLIDEEARSVVQEWDVAEAQRAQRFGDDHGGGSGKVPKGAMQLGCAFLKGDVPVSVGFNGQITVLPSSSSSSASKILTGHQAPISSLALGPISGSGSRSIFTSDTDGILVEWDSLTGTAKGRIAPPADVDDPDLSWRVHGSAAAVSSGVCGSTLYSAGWDDVVRCIDVSNDGGGAPRRRFCSGAIPLASQPVAMSTGKNLVLVLTVDGLVLLRDGEAVSEQPIRVPYAPTAACLSHDDATAYVGSEDGMGRRTRKWRPR